MQQYRHVERPRAIQRVRCLRVFCLVLTSFKSPRIKDDNVCKECLQISMEQYQCSHTGREGTYQDSSLSYRRRHSTWICLERLNIGLRVSCIANAQTGRSHEIPRNKGADLGTKLGKRFHCTGYSGVGLRTRYSGPRSRRTWTDLTSSSQVAHGNDINNLESRCVNQTTCSS